MMNRVGGSHQSHVVGSVPSMVTQHQQQRRSSSSSSSLTWLSTSWSTSSSSTFPQKLMSIMLDHAYEDGRNVNAGDIICWLPHGKSFFIKDRDRFSHEILPRYFDGRTADFRSFTRRLLRWGFKRVPRGDEVGAFYHENFLKDQPELCSKIKPCSRSGATSSSSETTEERKSVVSPNSNAVSTVEVDSAASVASSSASSSGKKKVKASRRQGSINKNMKRQDFISDAPSKVIDVVGPHPNVAQANQMTKEQQAWMTKMNQQQIAHDLTSRYKRISADSITSNGTGISSSSHFQDDDVAEPPEYAPNLSVGRTDGKIAPNSAFCRTGSQVGDDHAAHFMNGNSVSEGAREKRRMLLDSLLVQQQLTLEHQKKKFQNEILEQEIEYEINRRAMLMSIQRRRQEEEFFVEQERSRALKEHLFAQIVKERIEQEMEQQRRAASGSQEAVLQMLLALQEQRHMATMNHGITSHPPAHDPSTIFSPMQQDDAYRALLRDRTENSTGSTSSMVATSIGNVGGSGNGKAITDAAVNKDLAADLDVALSLVNLRRR